MSLFTLPLSDATAALETVGGKGLSLTKMICSGFPVPDGFHITTEAYRYFIAANGLQPKILAALADMDDSLPSTLETASATISRFFAEALIPEEISVSIKNAYLTLGNSHLTLPVAVRSSATAEDLPEASDRKSTRLNSSHRT